MSTPAESVKYSPLIVPKPLDVTEVRPLTNHGTGNLQPDVDLLLRDLHGSSLLLSTRVFLD